MGLLRQTLLCPVLFALVGAAWAAPDTQTSQPEVPAIAEVSTFSQLRGLKPVTREGDWDIRLGIADGGKAAQGAWKLLYCHATYVGTAKKPTTMPSITKLPSSNSILGPLHVRVRRVDRKGNAVCLEEYMVCICRNNVVEVRVSQYGQQGKFGEELYCAAIDTSGKSVSVCVFRGHYGDAGGYGSAVARAEIKGMVEDVFYWQPFLVRWNAEATTKPALSIRMNGWASLPLYPQFAPIWAALPGDGKALAPKDDSLPGPLPPTAGYENRYFLRWADLSRFSTKPWRSPETLPSTRPADQYPLVLGLKDGQLIVHLSNIADWDKPSAKLLARWWINGQPVQAHFGQSGLKRPKESDTKDIERVSPDQPDLSVPLVLPSESGAKLGDRMKLQVLFCPTGFARAGNMVSLGNPRFAETTNYPAFMPMLSNELEFTVTRDMFPSSTKAPVN